MKLQKPPGSSDVDDFNSNRYPPDQPKLSEIPSILEGKFIQIPYVLYDGDIDPILCKTCVPAYAHSCFIINGLYLLKQEDALREAKRLK